MSQEQGATSGTPTSGGGSGKKKKKKKGPGNAKFHTGFEGKTEEIKNHVHDVGPKHRDQFNRTTREIAEHIARTCKSGGEFINAFNPDDLGFETLNQASNPSATAAAIEMETWKMDLREHREKKNKRDEMSKQACSVTLGQCSDAVRDRITAHDQHESIQQTFDVIALLNLIKTSLHSGATNRKHAHSAQEATEALFSFEQTARMTNSKYSEKFKELVSVLEHCGVILGQEDPRVNEILETIAADKSAPTDDERREAKSKASDECFAMLFIRNADKNRYGDMTSHIANAKTWGNDHCPKSLPKACECLVNCVPSTKHMRANPSEEGTSFCSDGGQGGRGQQGRGGRGRGRSGRSGGRGTPGRGRSGERAQKQNEDKDNADDEEEVMMNEAEPEEMGQAPGSESDTASAKDDECICLNIVAAETCFQEKKLSDENVMLDSASTTNIISNSNMLRNTRKAKMILPVRSLAGLTCLDEIADCGNYPFPVWHHPDGTANIISLHDATKHCHITMDSHQSNAFPLHRPGQEPVTFAPSPRGLCQSALTEGMSGADTWPIPNKAPNQDTDQTCMAHHGHEEELHFQTADQIRQLHPERLHKRALRARQFQNILMRPGARQLSNKATRHLANCPMTKSDIAAAEHLFGPNLGALKGRTTRTVPQHVMDNLDPVPPGILRVHRNVTLCVDAMFVNKIPFLVTRSRHTKFATVEPLDNRQVPTITKRLRSVIRLCRHRGFNVVNVFADHEFEPIRPEFPNLNTAAAGEHVPDIERHMRTMKERTRATCDMLPFTHIPRLVLTHLVRNSVLWLNSLPAHDGVSNEHSPRHIMTGRELTCDKHVRIEFGKHVQTHEEHDNSMTSRTLGAIALGPTGNTQGGHWFMSLTSGARIMRYQWTELPMPRAAVDRASRIGQGQNMPTTITYANRRGDETVDTIGDCEDDNSESDDESCNSDSSSDADLMCDSDSESDDSSDSSDDDDNNDDDDDDHDDDDDAGDSDNEADDDSADHPKIQQNDRDSQNGNDDAERSGNTPTQSITIGEESGNTNRPCSNENDDHSVETTGVEDNADEDIDTETTGVDGNQVGITGVEDNISDADVELSQPTEEDRFRQAESDGARAAADNQPRALRRRNPPKRDPDCICSILGEEHATFAALVDLHAPEGCFMAAMQPHAKELMVFLTEQMSAKKGLKIFGKRGAEALMKELKQLLTRDAMHPVKAKSLTQAQRIGALKCLMFLKEKRSGDVKGRGCADGRKQRAHKTKEETRSPTVATEAMIIASIIDARERRDAAIVDVPGAFMQAFVDELTHVKLEGDMVDLIIRLDPTYAQHVTHEKGRRVTCTQLDKALCGTLQAALLFWRKLTSFLIDELGFEMNPCDSCACNKIIRGKQFTICWHVDDLKLSHKYPKAVGEIINRLDKEFGKEAPLTAQRGRVFADCLGMTMDFSSPGKVKFSMKEHIDRAVEETPIHLMKGPCTTPAANHLFRIDDTLETLPPQQSDLYHHLTAKLLHLAKRARPDMQTAISFLCTRVRNPTNDDMKKLGRCIRYLSTTRELCLTLEADDSGVMQWWVDASCAVHPNMRSHTGATMTMGKGCPYSISSKQKINTRSSAEAELVGVNDAMGMMLWTRLFLLGQGHSVRDNVICQDNQSTMLLENNGKMSSSKKTKHIEIRYYFITDNIKRKTARVECCPADEMLADFFTKPLQGSAFYRFRQRILNLDSGPSVNSTSDVQQECVGNGGGRPDTNQSRVSKGSDVETSKPFISSSASPKVSHAEAVKRGNGHSIADNRG